MRWMKWMESLEKRTGDMNAIMLKKSLRNHDIFPHIIQTRVIIFYNMLVDYTKLWTRYKEMGHKNKTDLIEMAGISTNILAKLNKGEYVSMESLHKICNALNCDASDLFSLNKTGTNK